MPTSGRKACLLLKEGKVSIYRKLPFTIKLNYKTGNTTQPGFLGIDNQPPHTRNFSRELGGFFLKYNGTYGII